MSCIGPWGETIEAFIDYCTDSDSGRVDPIRRNADIAPVPGFIESSFNPLVYRTIQYFVENARIRDHAKLAIVLGSAFGDTATADLASRNLLSGKIRNPLLFYQSVPNSILGFAASRFHLTEMMTCITYNGGAAAALFDMAELYLSMPDVEQVLVIGVETQSDRVDEMYAHLAKDGEPAFSHDTVVSLLLEQASAVQAEDQSPLFVQDIVRLAPGEKSADEADAWRCPIPAIGNAGLLNLVLAAEQLRRQDESGGGERTVPDATFGGDQYAITIVRRPHLV